MTRIILGITFGLLGGFFASKVVEIVGAASAASLNAAVSAIGR